MLESLRSLFDVILEKTKTPLVIVIEEQSLNESDVDRVQQ